MTAIGTFGGIPVIGSAVVTGLIACTVGWNRDIRPCRVFATATGGNAIANYALKQEHGSAGPFNLKNEVLNPAGAVWTRTRGVCRCDCGGYRC